MSVTTSTYSMTASLRRTLSLLQADLARGQKELSTGRHADLGLALGLRASQSFTIVGFRNTVDAILASNQLVDSRLDTTQVALSALLSDAEQMRASLITAKTDGGEPLAIVTQAKQSLATFVAKLNSSNADGFIFGGIRTDQSPIANYFGEPPANNKRALDAAFSAHFGFSQADPAVATITAAQMQDFLAGPFESLFSETSWKADWSSASDALQRSQVSLSVTMDASVTANEPALQKLASAYAMLSDLGADRLNRDAYAAVLGTAMDKLTSGIGLLMKTQARVGVMQSTVKNASDIMAIQKDSFDTQLQELETVDPAEASTRVSDLLTRIETSYALTARISQLSLSKYL